MATLFLICGLPGAGKTTLARQLEQTRAALRLCPDEWIVPLLTDLVDRSKSEPLRTYIEGLQFQVAKRALVLGINVILENGFWTREERAEYAAQARAVGARVELFYLPATHAELWQRLAKRKANPPPGTIVITEAELKLYESWFEPPTAKEIAAINSEPTDPFSKSSEQRNTMTNHAQGEFQVQIVPQTQDQADGTSLSRLSLDKQFTGDLQATGKGEMLAAGAPTGAGVYVAIERVTGTLHGKQGSFILVHHGTMDKTSQELKINVAQDSGTGELRGLAGNLTITIADGKHFYDLEYTFG